MSRALFVVGLLFAMLPAAHADDSIDSISGVELRRTWAECPFTLVMAERRANRELGLELAGQVVVRGTIAPRVEYSVKTPHGRLRVTVVASMKGDVRTTWHSPDTDPENRHELQIEGAGLAGSIQAAKLSDPLVAQFQIAVEECLGRTRSP